MAYALRYYKEFTHTDGTVIRLEIHKKDSTEEAIEIGDVVQGLSLQIQGQQDDIDSPIQKTSVLMTFVDAPDIEDGHKNGFWEEFYTADATQWKVIIKERGAMLSSYNTIWGGYITPDSFSEDLVYRGSVSITARDNIGHMQDFPFDAEGDNKGMIKLWDLVRLGWAKIESPMSLDWHGDGNGVNWLYTEYGNILYNTLMNVSFFEDMNWYEAIEKALYSYGLVMRYVGRNRVHICPLRDLPKHGYHDYEYFATLEPVFVSGARRELAPAVKEIRESVSYDLVNEISQPQIKEDDFTGVQTSYKCKIEGDTWGTLEHDAPIWAINPTNNWGQLDASKSLFFDTSRYEVGNFTKRAGNEDELRKYMYIAANNVDTRSVRFFCLVNPTDLVIRIKFGLPISLTLAGVMEQQSAFCLHRIMYSISINQGGTIYHYSGNGDWTNTENEVLKEYDPQQNVTEFEVEVFPNDDIIQGIESTYASLCLTIHKIEYRQIGYGSLQKTGLYACIQALTIEVPGTKSLCEKNDVNTIYNEDNNVILDRDPELAPAFDLVPLGGFIKNGILDAGNYAPFPPGGFRYPNGESFQLAVHIHKQLLCYHAKPNSVISGTIINSGMLGLACNWLWRGKEHILMSGNLNLLNGHMENAVIREFTRYEDMWSDVAGADMPDTEQDSRSNVEGGASSGGATSTYSSTTNVYIGSGGGGGSYIVVDSAMSSTSTNPVQNKVVKQYVDAAEANAKKYTDDKILQIEAGTYKKPSTGIPKTDLASDVQASLGKADTALQSVPDNYATKTNLAEALAPIGTLYKGAWTAVKTEGISQLYTERITVPAGTYIISAVLPYAKVGHGNQICIGFTAKMAIGVGNTFLDASYGCTTQIATFTTTTSIAVMSAASANSAEWDYLDRGGIAALRIA